MIDLGNDVVAYVDYEETHSVELARGFSDATVLHKDLIFQTRENKLRHGIASVSNANVRFENGRTSCLSVLRTIASVTRSATRNSPLFLDGLPLISTVKEADLFGTSKKSNISGFFLATH